MQYGKSKQALQQDAIITAVAASCRHAYRDTLKLLSWQHAASRLTFALVHTCTSKLQLELSICFVCSSTGIHALSETSIYITIDSNSLPLSLIVGIFIIPQVCSNATDLTQICAVPGNRVWRLWCTCIVEKCIDAGVNHSCPQQQVPYVVQQLLTGFCICIQKSPPLLTGRLSFTHVHIVLLILWSVFYCYEEAAT